MHVGPTCEGGCPFSHYDSSHLYTMLKSDDIETRHLEILDLSSQGRYSDACGVYLSEKLKVNKPLHRKPTIWVFDQV